MRSGVYLALAAALHGARGCSTFPPSKDLVFRGLGGYGQYARWKKDAESDRTDYKYWRPDIG